jgi:hypothetical protein
MICGFETPRAGETARDDESTSTTIGPARSTIAPPCSIPLSGTLFLFFHAYWAESRLNCQP